MTDVVPKTDSKDEMFLDLWLKEHLHDDYYCVKRLGDTDYVLYTVWCQFNEEKLYKQYLPKTVVFSGSINRTDKIIFHGGCQPCISQSLHEVKRCFDCKYFKAEWSKKDLSIRSEQKRIT
jgi:hypothetical protein